jgi:hypothetical protein
MSFPKIPSGLLKALAGLAIGEVTKRLGDDEEDDPTPENMAEAFEALELPDSDASLFAAQVVADLFTEERTDQMLALLAEKISLPLGVEGVVIRALDDQLPEVLRGPILGSLGYQWTESGVEPLPEQPPE